MDNQPVKQIVKALNESSNSSTPAAASTTTTANEVTTPRRVIKEVRDSATAAAAAVSRTLSMDTMITNGSSNTSETTGGPLTASSSASSISSPYSLVSAPASASASASSITHSGAPAAAGGTTTGLFSPLLHPYATPVGSSAVPPPLALLGHPVAASSRSGVRFSYRLMSERNAEWSENYIAYNHLKALISEVESSADRASPKLAEFRTRIETELAKVDQFFIRLSSELAERFRYLAQQATLFASASESEKLRHGEDLQRSMRDLYVQTFLLEEFGSLNVMGFQRVLAKYDLRVKSTVSLSEEYVEAVAKSNFANTDDLTVMTTGLEKLYADTFENGNRRKAVAVLTTFLQSDPRTQPQPIPQNLLSKKGWIIDMDGVLYYQNHLLPGVIEFVEWLKTEKKRFLFLTNSSERSPKELQQKLGRLGIHVGETQFYNSSLSTAEFLQRQKPNGSAFVIGEAGLISALYEVGYTMNEIDPDYVVIGETRNYNYERMQLAVNLVRRGAKLIGTNVDVYDKALNGVSPGTACLVAPIELATGSKAYYLGKPNPLMLRSAMRKLGCDAKDTVIIGDRMDTDIIGGIESGIETILVLSGVTSMDELKRYAYRPDHIMGSVSDIAALSKVHS